jgi:hypothetical protein
MGDNQMTGLPNFGMTVHPEYAAASSSLQYEREPLEEGVNSKKGLKLSLAER